GAGTEGPRGALTARRTGPDAGARPGPGYTRGCRVMRVHRTPRASRPEHTGLAGSGPTRTTDPRAPTSSPSHDRPGAAPRAGGAAPGPTAAAEAGRAPGPPRHCGRAARHRVSAAAPRGGEI